MKGVLDRFADNNLAVILIEAINQELIIPRTELPKGSKEGTWFHMAEKTGVFTIAAIDHETTKAQTNKAAELLKKLRNKSSESKFKRK